MAIAAPLRRAAGDPCPWCHVVMGFTAEELAEHLPPDRYRNASYPTRDHVIPRRLRPVFVPGREHNPWIVIVCVRCNGDKGSRTIDQWRRWLYRMKDPREPIVAAWADANPKAWLTWSTEDRSNEGDGHGWTEQGDADRAPGQGPGGQEPE